MIHAINADTDTVTPVTCPECGSDLSIADGLDIGFLQCDLNEKHQWTLHTAMTRTPTPGASESQ